MWKELVECVTHWTLTVQHFSLFTCLGELLIGTQFTHVIARVPQSFCPNNISTSTLHRVPFLNGEAVELLAVRREARLAYETAFTCNVNRGHDTSCCSATARIDSTTNPTAWLAMEKAPDGPASPESTRNIQSEMFSVEMAVTKIYNNTYILFG
jgi:hypothetical protein